MFFSLLPLGYFGPASFRTLVIVFVVAAVVVSVFVGVYVHVGTHY